MSYKYIIKSEFNTTTCTRINIQSGEIKQLSLFMKKQLKQFDLNFLEIGEFTNTQLSCADPR